MNDFFDKTFYGGTIGEWLLALVIILSGIIFAKAVYWLFGKVIKKITTKTKTKFDDILIERLQGPIVFAIIIISFWYGIHTLSISDKISAYIDKIYYGLIFINIAWLVSRIFDSIVQEYLVPLVAKSESDLDDQLLPIVRKGIKSTIWIIAVVVGLNNAGYDVGALIAGLGLGGLAIAMAAKDYVANLFGGFTIFTDKPFTINDRVKIDGFDGFVREIGIRTTKLQTLDGRMVSIPNMIIASNSIENITSEPSRKIVSYISLSLENDPGKIELAINMMKEAALNNQDTENEVTAAFENFGEYSIKIIFIYFVKRGLDVYEIPNQINFEVLKKFRENGIKLAIPSRTIYK